MISRWRARLRRSRTLFRVGGTGSAGPMTRGGNFWGKFSILYLNILVISIGYGFSSILLLTPEQAALQGVPPNTALGLGIAAVMTGGLAGAAYGTEILASASDAFAVYKAAQAGYSLTTATASGAAISGGGYTLGAVVSAYFNSGNNGQSFASSFDQKFSLTGLAAASTVGAYNSIFGTSMFSWAGISNSASNIFTVPGLVIRLNGFFLGQFAGRAAQGAVNQSK